MLRAKALIGLAAAILTGACIGGRSEAEETDAPKMLIELHAKAYVENWVVFGGGIKEMYLYQPTTAKRTARGTTTVWGVNMPNPDSTDWYGSRHAFLESKRKRHESTSGWERYFYTKVQWEIDCQKGQVGITQMVFYDEDGVVIRSGKPSDDLEDPVPDSNADRFLRSFCNQTRRRYFREVFDDTTSSSEGNR